jgi:hypothetical protein
MTTISQCYERWLKFNLQGRGAEHGTASNHRYRGSVYYYGDTPAQRIVKRDGRTPVIIQRFHLGSIPSSYKSDFEVISVEDIAVFSKYDGDRLDGQDMHDRQRWMMLNRINAFVDEEVGGWSAETCASISTRGRAEKTLNKYLDTYERYATLFNLNWPMLPHSVRERMMSTIVSRGLRWTDPAEVKKRERASAKRLANKALGLV